MVTAICGGDCHHLYSERFLGQVLELTSWPYRGLTVGWTLHCKEASLGSSRPPGDLRLMMDLSGGVLA